MDPHDATRELQTAAASLAHALGLLEACKTTRGAIRSERIMRSTPGPSLPGNPRAILAAVDIDDALYELCCDLRDDVDPGRALTTDGARLCVWLSSNAAAIAATIDWVDDLLVELHGLTRRARRVVGYRETDTPAAEPRQYAPAICQRLAALGYRATPSLLPVWSHRAGEAITVEKRHGKNTYLLSEVLAWVTRDRPGPAVVLRLEEP